MKRRIGIALVGAATLVMLVGIFSFPVQVKAQQQDESTVKTMWVVPRGAVLSLRLYDKPDPLGTTMKTVPAGLPIEVETAEMYAKYWYKTTEGYYAHFYYLTDVDPAFDAAAERATMSEADLQREDELLQKYPNLARVAEIMGQRVSIGMEMEMVIDSWGRPDDQRTVPSTMGDTFTWTYDTPPGGLNRTVIKFNEVKKVISIATDR
ncbi:hypothetical protein ACFL3H_07145 [Gemmatimonadota bacterium]